MSYAVNGNSDERIIQLKDLTKLNAELGTCLKSCSAIYTECSFELAFAVLAPRELKPITGKGIKGLVSKTVSLVGACESAYYHLGSGTRRPSDSKNLEVLRPRRAAESGDEHLFQYLLTRLGLISERSYEHVH